MTFLKQSEFHEDQYGELSVGMGSEESVLVLQMRDKGGLTKEDSAKDGVTWTNTGCVGNRAKETF